MSNPNQTLWQEVGGDVLPPDPQDLPKGDPNAPQMAWQGRVEDEHGVPAISVGKELIQPYFGPNPPFSTSYRALPPVERAEHESRQNAAAASARAILGMEVKKPAPEKAWSPSDVLDSMPDAATDIQKLRANDK